MKQAHAMGEEARRAAQQEQDKLRKEIGNLMAKLAKVPHTTHSTQFVKTKAVSGKFSSSMLTCADVC